MDEVDAVLRTEHKYLMTDLERYRLQNKFSQILHEDANNGVNGYMVRSLYFDTPDYCDYYEKLDGILERRKLRLRIYDTQATTAKLELKEKFGAYQQKRSLSLSRQQAYALASGDASPLLTMENPFAHELYNLIMTKIYRPTCIVNYQRFAYVQPGNNIRITFDGDVRACMSPFGLFDKHLVCCPVLSFGQTLMEVKFDHFLLSYIKDTLGGCEHMETAVSKYCMARLAGNLY